MSRPSKQTEFSATLEALLSSGAEEVAAQEERISGDLRHRQWLATRKCHLLALQRGALRILRRHIPPVQFSDVSLSIEAMTETSYPRGGLPVRLVRPCLTVHVRTGEWKALRTDLRFRIPFQTTEDLVSRIKVLAEWLKTMPGESL